ncbi:MAG: hypothetical protein PHN49_08330 [Candidatus Omnitrophica bacterium]|nr:hypothetical protein [Candidatus Omnitrophota bacterium]
MATDFVSGFLGGLIAGMAGSTGGGGPGTVSEWGLSADQQQLGQGLLSQIGEGIKKFGTGVAKLAGNVVSFGQKALGTLGQITKEGFQKAANAFSGLFSRETQEALYKEETGVLDGELTVAGDQWTYKVGDSVLKYDSVTDTIRDAGFGVGGIAQITGAGIDDAGNTAYQKLDYKTISASGGELSQYYENGYLSKWSYGVDGAALITADGSGLSSGQRWMDSYGNLIAGNVEIDAPIVIERPDDLDTPENEAKKLSIPFIWNISVLGGQIAKASVQLINQQTSAGSSPSAPSDERDLFALVNGVLNDNHFSSPSYLLNLQSDIVKESENKVAIDDIILAPTFFQSLALTLVGLGFTANDISSLAQLANPSNYNPVKIIAGTVIGDFVSQLLNGAKDSLNLIIEAMDRTVQASLAGQIKGSMESYFDEKGDDDRAREMIGVGYSGGFMPLAEVLINNLYNAAAKTGYNAKSLVGLGGICFDLGKLSQALVDKVGFLVDALRKVKTTTVAILDSIEKELISLIGIAKDLTLPGIEDDVVQTTMDYLRQGSLIAAHEFFLNKAKEMVAMLTAAQPTDLTSSKMNVVVNVYGTKDIFNEFEIGGINFQPHLTGYRDEIGKYSLTDRNHPLVNVEIVGAGHHDFIRNDSTIDFLRGGFVSGAANWTDLLLSEDEIAWNITVSEFIARLVNNSVTKDSTDAFLQSLGSNVANYDVTRKVWVITLT